MASILRYLHDSRGVSLYEITAAVAMTAILAAVSVPVIIDRITDTKAARATLELAAISGAMDAFQRDTGKMPGEAEALAEGSDKTLLVSDLGGLLPDNAAVALALSGATITSTGRCTTGCLDLNDYLIRPPAPSQYANWRGPYMDEVKSDPFDRVYVVNLRALVRGEAPGAAGGGGSFGYGWALSGGADRKLVTALGETALRQDSDDLGTVNGKKLLPR